MNNDFDYIKSRFDSDGIKPPKALDEKIENALEGRQSAKRIPFVRTKPFRAAVSLVACLAIFVAGFSVAYGTGDARITDNSANTEPMSTFSSKRDLESYIKRSYPSGVIFNLNGDIAQVKGEAGNNVDQSSVSDSSTEYAASNDMNEALSHSETYIQEKGVDEADTIKTNGRYIFKRTLRKEKNYYGSSVISIFSVDNGKTRLACTLDCLAELKSKNGNPEIIDFFVKDNRLVVEISDIMIGCCYEDNIQGNTYCIIYDITNAEKPERIYFFRQSGNYCSSRMVGDTLYLISSHRAYRDTVVYKDIAPCYSENNQDEKCVEPSDIARPRCKGNYFTTVSAIDTKGCRLAAKAKSVLGDCLQVYCTDNSLYIIGYDFSGKERKTIISRVNLADELTFGPSCTIKGYFNSEYSFTEKDDIFYAGITQGGYNEQEKSYIYSFDKNLKLISRTKPFGVDESIKAVKFMGDWAYVITYKEIDPLFVIDISNPADMKIKGSVEITGFSTMLVPIGNGRLIGIGNATATVDYGEGFDEEDSVSEYVSGVKLALFDISNPEKPRVLDSKEYADCSSEAQFNPRALIINSERDYMAIPTDYFEKGESGAIVFSVRDDKLVDKDSFTYKESGIEDYYNSDFNTRVVFIGDYIYSLGGDGSIHSQLIK